MLHDQRETALQMIYQRDGRFADVNGMCAIITGEPSDLSADGPLCEYQRRTAYDTVNGIYQRGGRFANVNAMCDITAGGPHDL
jgi:hypothetical protein